MKQDLIQPQTSCFVGFKKRTEKQNDLAKGTKQPQTCKTITVRQTTKRHKTNMKRCIRLPKDAKRQQREEKQLHRGATRQQTDAKWLQMSRGVCSRFVFQIATQIYTLFCLGRFHIKLKK